MGATPGIASMRMPRRDVMDMRLLRMSRMRGRICRREHEQRTAHGNNCSEYGPEPHNGLLHQTPLSWEGSCSGFEIGLRRVIGRVTGPSRVHLSTQKYFNPARRVRTFMTTQSEHEFFKERGFGQKMGFGERPAIIVIDIIKAFTDPARPLGADLQSQIDAIRQIVDIAHTRKIPVIFSSVRYDEADTRDAGIWRLKQKGVIDLAADSDGHEVDPRLEVGPDDSLLMKKYASCFFGTDLVPRLTTQRIDTLIITGCTTSGCVRATAVDSVQYGFRPMVVREAVGDRSSASHEQSLFDLDAKYADVVSLHETLDYLRTVSANS
jgi:maleamate amidohydrolase